MPDSADPTPKPEPSPGPLPPLQGEGKPMKVDKVQANQPRSRKARPVVQLPAATKPPRRKMPVFGRYLLWVFLVALLVGGGILTYLTIRETRLEVVVDPGSLQLRPEAAVIFEFNERAGMIRRSLAERRAPLEEQLTYLGQALNAAKADLAGKEQAKRLILDSIDQDQKEIEAILGDSRKQLNRLWTVESDAIDKEYDAALKTLMDQIRSRAASLGLPFNPKTDYQSPEVYVNAFRLALYGAPSTVKTTEERQWAEGLLAEWRKKEEGWDERRRAVRDKAAKVREPVGTRVESVEERIQRLRGEVAVLEGDVQMIQAEITKQEGRIGALQGQYEEVFLPFYQDLLATPADYVRFKLPLTGPNRIDMRELENNPNFPPGDYVLFLQADGADGEYWAVVPFTLRVYEDNKVQVPAEAFKPARSWIE
jgi:hypothetical protein